MFHFQMYNDEAKFMYKFTSQEQWQGFQASASVLQLPIRVLTRFPDNVPSILTPGKLMFSHH